PRLTRIRDALVAGLAMENGDTFGGPDPRGIARRAAHDGEARPKAASLGELSRAEFVRRALALDARFYDAHTYVEPEQTALTMAWKRGARRGSLEYYTSPYARMILESRLERADAPFQYATDDQVFVIAHGTPEDGLLSRLVAGLGVNVMTSSR